jgi:hypothetical protein
LRHVGIRTVLMRHCREIGVRVAFLITALHQHSDIDRAVEAIGRAMRVDHPIRLPTGRAS